MLAFAYAVLLYISFFSAVAFVACVGFLRGFEQQKVILYNQFGGDATKLRQALWCQYAYLIALGCVL